MEKLSHLLAHRRIPGEHPGRRFDLHDDNLQREPTVEEVSSFVYFFIPEQENY